MRATCTLALCILFLGGAFPIRANADLAEGSGVFSSTFTDVGAGLSGVRKGSVAWGDYDNDGDLDILLTGEDEGFDWVAKIYRNDGGGTFADIGAGLTGVHEGSAAWGDYDNDGDLDILLTGEAFSGRVSKVYRNDGGVFTDINAGLTGVSASSIAWGDYDNDGDLDILLTGWDGALQVAKIYRNDGGGTFTDIDAGLGGLSVGTVAWGDYDNDGDLDILLEGLDAEFSRVAKIYRNDGGATFVDIGAGLTGVYDGSVAWGDYDSDGDLDVLLTGFTEGFNSVSKVYRNDGGATFVDIGAALVGVGESSSAWGDYDNDGDIDILLAGFTVGLSRVSKIYRNDGGGTFADIGAGLTGTSASSVAWGDHDNDGDLDVLIAGRGGSIPIAHVYRNDGATPNTTPSAPVGLSATWSGGQITFTWTASSDAETPANGLSYNLRIGTTPGGSEISSAQADTANGYRLLPALGNSNQNLGWTLEALEVPVLYWSVQAIDGAWAGSPFATEETLSRFNDIGAGLTGVFDASVAWGDYDNDGDLDVFVAGYSLDLGPVSTVYRNDNGVFTDIGAGLTGLHFGSVAWGDYDNDSDLDILLSGFDGEANPVTKIYRNDGGGAFTDISAALPGVTNSSVAWGDYDNDGDLDILLSGIDSGDTPLASIYRNEGGGTFTDIGAGLTGVGGSSVAWGDYDNDGDLDILLTGTNGFDQAKVYRNDGGGAFTDIGAGLTEVSDSSVAWGDHDNDGDLDILLTGSGSGNVAKVYRNDGGGTFTDINAALPGVGDSSVSWGDFDNDGDLDILLVGAGSGGLVAKLYRNDGGGTFTDINVGLTGVEYSSVAFGDFDDDGDLDFVLAGAAAGFNLIANIYRNDAGVTPNAAPSAPTNLSASWSAGKATFTWTASTDAETPTDGLSYNLRVGTTPGGSDITAVQADVANGYRRLPALGNANQNLSWAIEIPDQPLYWSAQAVDGAWAGSDFAVESSVGVSSVDDSPGIPVAYALRPGAPNPFGSSARIQFDLPFDEAQAVLEVFDVGGRLVRILHRGALPAGQHTVDWDGRDGDGRDVAAGIYLYRLRTASFDEAGRLVRFH